jgi:hypothetical protein
MQPRFSNERYAVFDDFLAPPDFAGVWRFVQAQRYERVHAHGWDPVWLLHDGEPLGSAVVETGESPVLERGSRIRGAAPVHSYPTGTHVDRLLEELGLAADALAPWIGRQGRDWTVVTARAFLYPKETGLGWHKDAGVFSGAFVYYAHPEWESYWGGELFVARLPKGRAALAEGSPLDPRALHRALSEIGAGEYIAPKPNRLVVLRAGTPHRINAVHAAAGSHVRCSIAGFFVRPEALAPE